MWITFSSGVITSGSQPAPRGGSNPSQADDGFLVDVDFLGRVFIVVVVEVAAVVVMVVMAMRVFDGSKGDSVVVVVVIVVAEVKVDVFRFGGSGIEELGHSRVG